MTQETFNIEAEVIQKPRIAAVPFLWSILKKWVFNNWQSILMLLLKVAFQKYGAIVKSVRQYLKLCDKWQLIRIK